MRRKTNNSAINAEQLAFVREEAGEVPPEPAQGSKPSPADTSMRTLTRNLMEAVVLHGNMALRGYSSLHESYLSFANV
jgi:hypothetical protein